MTLYTGTVDSSGGLASTAMVHAIRDHLVSEGWTLLEEQTYSSEPSIFMVGPGLSGLEEIYFHMRSIVSGSQSYVFFTSMTSFVPGANYLSQPGYVSATIAMPLSGVVDYYMIANGQRFMIGTSNQTLSQNVVYIGKFFPYAAPGEYGYPVVLKGSASSVTETSFHTTTAGVHFLPGPTPVSNSIAFYPGQDAPFSTSDSTLLTGSAPSIDIDGDITMFPGQLLEYSGTGNRFYMLGQYDGIFAIGAYNVSPLSVIQEGGSSEVDQTGLSVVDAVNAIEAVGGVAYIVFRSGNSTATNSFLALGVS